MRFRGYSGREIAYRLKRSPSTISRELRRNGADSYRVYHARVAQLRSMTRKSKAHKRPRLKTRWIRRYVTSKLKLGWSPEQISGRLSIDRPGYRISHEAIYQYVYDPVVRREHDLIQYLPRSHRRRRRRGNRRLSQISRIAYRIGINDRSVEAGERSQVGHWESDSVISRGSLHALNVTVERATRYTRITKMRDRTARETSRAVVRALEKLPECARRTITYDNGSENTGHLLTNHFLGTKSFFCNPYHFWERGTNENTIGLVRRVYPKGTNFETVKMSSLKRL